MTLFKIVLCADVPMHLYGGIVTQRRFAKPTETNYEGLRQYMNIIRLSWCSNQTVFIYKML